MLYIHKSFLTFELIDTTGYLSDHLDFHNGGSFRVFESSVIQITISNSQEIYMVALKRAVLIVKSLVDSDHGSGFRA